MRLLHLVPTFKPTAEGGMKLTDTKMRKKTLARFPRRCFMYSEVKYKEVQGKGGVQLPRLIHE